MMTDWNDRFIPPPAEWQAFERLCHRLWMRIWEDPNAQMNGRSGQTQYGVDVFGQRKDTGAWCGVQCKKKESLHGTGLTEVELRTEIKKAKGFRPALSQYIVATTAESDAAIQSVAREITEAHRPLGLFSVHVFGWKEIVLRLSEHCPDIIDDLLHIPAETQAAPEILSSLASMERSVLAAQGEIQAVIGRVLGKLTVLTSQTSTGAGSGSAVAHAQLDQCRDLLRDRSPSTALRLLERLRDQHQDATADIKFRIHTNIGAAHLALGDGETAAAEFLEAYAIEPTSDKAAANRVLALLLRHQFADARTAAVEATAAHPQSSLAWSILIAANVRVNEGLPVLDIPPAIADSLEVLFALGNALAIQRDYEGAESLLRRAWTANPNDVDVQTRLADVLLARGTNGGHVYLGGIYTDADLGRVREAASLLESAWATLRLTEIAGANIIIPNNRCAIFLALGEIDQAQNVVDEGLVFAPRDPALLRVKIRVSVVCKDLKAARAALEVLPADDPDYPFLRATVLRTTDPNDALSVLEAFIRRLPADSNRMDPTAMEESEAVIVARCLFADILCEADLANAEARFNSLPLAADPSVTRSTLIFAQALRAAGRVEEARRYLESARTRWGNTQEKREQAMLADALFEFGEFSEAAAYYGGLVFAAFDSPTLRRYLFCLLELDRRHEFHAFAEQLAPEVLGRPYIQRLLADLAVRTGNLPEALGHLERCLQGSPRDLSVRIRWADVCVRLGRTAEVAFWWKQERPSLKGASREALHGVAHILQTLGEYDDAAAIVYQAHRNYEHDARAQLGMVGLVLSRPDDRWQVAEDALVDVGLAVGVRDDSGVERAYIVENLPEEDLRHDEITVRGGLGVRLRGHKVGDSIATYQGDITSHHGTVTWVKHKYIHALHSILGSFNTRFPDESGLVGVSMPQVGTQEERIAPILRTTEQRQKLHHAVADLYGQHPMPVAMAANLVGRNVLELWPMPFGLDGPPLVVCAGNAQERDAALKLLDIPERSYILEPFTLLTLGSLDLLHLLENAGYRVVVVQETIELLRREIKEAVGQRSGYFTVGYKDGKLVRSDVTAEDVQRRIAGLERIHAWLQAHCQVVPAVPAHDLSNDIAQQMRESLDAATYDTLLAASGGGHILISDDWRLRNLGKEILAVDGVWTQVFLMRARRLGQVTDANYSKAVIALAAWNFQFTSVNAEDLFAAAERANWAPDASFRSMVRTLNLTSSELGSLVVVVVAFLARLWLMQDPKAGIQEVERLTYATLHGINPSTAPNCYAFLGQLQSHASAGRLPMEAYRAVLAYYRGHFLLPYPAKIPAS